MVPYFEHGGRGGGWETAATGAVECSRVFPLILPSLGLINGVDGLLVRTYSVYVICVIPWWGEK